MSLTIRKATKRDSKAILELVVGLANFERLEPPDGKAKRRILRDAFETKRISILVATLDRAHAGYALYFYTYSSFLARQTLYLEDIFVYEKFRGRGVGEALFRACAEEAARHRCGRMEWSVLTWNESAMGFYERLGARRLKEWYVYRLDSDALSRLNRKVQLS